MNIRILRTEKWVWVSLGESEDRVFRVHRVFVSQGVFEIEDVMETQNLDNVRAVVGDKMNYALPHTTYATIDSTSPDYKPRFSLFCRSHESRVNLSFKESIEAHLLRCQGTLGSQSGWYTR